MRLAEPIIRALDFFYVRPVAVLLPRQTFRYAACGLMTLGLDAVWYALFYNFVFDRVDFSLGPIVLSPHIAALVLVFPITFFTGFWLNRHVAFRTSPLAAGTQLWRYGLSVVGSILLTYGSMKLLVELCGIWPTPSKALTNVITVIYSYLTAKYFTFRHAVE